MSLGAIGDVLKKYFLTFALMIKTGYAYLFFFLYNSVNKVKNNFLVQWKAVLMVLILESLLILSIVTYYLDIFKITVAEDFNKLFLLIFVIPLVGLKLWFFERNDNWRKYLVQFEAWPEKRRKKWDWVMRLLIVFIIGNLIFSFYIMSEIDWKQYR